MNFTTLKPLLDSYYHTWCEKAFIADDPVSVPHAFSDEQNIEIAGFLTATIAWGQRKTIIRNAMRLMVLMDNNPAGFLYKAAEKDFERFAGFKHRTLNGDDTVYLLRSLRHIYLNHGGLKKLFEGLYLRHGNLKLAIGEFRKVFFELPGQPRTHKHFADVYANAAAKRINMFLRWMVRHDTGGVDFGLWRAIPPSALFIPLDLHTGNTARNLGLLTRKQNDWKAVEELTANLRLLDADDPVKYDYALFGAGIYKVL